MDKREFYKKLMTEYTFDEERIRRNAKRKNPNWFFASKWLPLGTAAAVFVAVFGGYMILDPILSKNNINPNPITTEQTVNASDRLASIEFNDYLVSNNKIAANENKTMYVTFARPMTYNSFEAALETLVSDIGNITILALWDESFIEAENCNKETEYTAAKISALISAYSELATHSIFASVEFNDKINDENFEPLILIEKQPEETHNTSQTAPTATTTAPVVTKTPEITSALDTTTPIPESSSETSQSNTVEIKMLGISIADVSAVEFINENHFLVLCRTSISLYRINADNSYEIVSSFETYNPKITYICAEEKAFTILGGEDSIRYRTQLFSANGLTNELIKVDTSQMTADANIASAYYNGGDVFIKTLATDLSYNAFYIAKKDNSGYNSYCYERFTEKTSVLYFDGESFIYSLSKADGNSSLYRVYYNDDFESLIDFEIDFEALYVRSNDLTSFAVINKEDGKAWLWNTEAQSFTDVFETENITFSEFNGEVFSDGNSWYRMLGDGVEILSSEAEALELSIKPIFSSTYNIYEVTLDGIKIELIS